MITYALDYETYWESEKEENPCTVRVLGNWLYTKHPRFDAYLLSVVGTDGFEWVGHPKDFEWARFEGARLVAHNAGFELAVTEHLRDLGIVPATLKWACLCDTADMAAALGFPRDLEQACWFLLNKEVDKSVRDKTKGKTWQQMQEIGIADAVSEYCLNDSRIELELWLAHSAKWPADEQELSQATLEMCWRGLPIDREGASADITLLHSQLEEQKALIPWAKTEKPLSIKQVKKMCEKRGIQPPRSMAKDSAEFEAWLFKHEDKHPWAKAMGKYRSINALVKKYETMVSRTDDNDIFRFGIKYWGGHLGRDSGDGGFNAQNCSRKPMHGVYLRNRMIKAPAGYVLGITDESSIEPKVLACLSGDTEKVQLMREGMDVYEIQARLDGDYSGEGSLKEYDKANGTNIRPYNKVKVLGCGYGAGTDKIQFIAKKEVGLELSYDEADAIKWKFRSREFIPNFWKQLEFWMRRSKGENYEMELLSGRSVLYRDVKDLGGLTAVVVKYNSFTRLPWWGGSLTENAVQATARDIFMYHVLRVRRELPCPILLRAHDEIVTLHKEEDAEQEMKAINAIMATPPPWMPEFPAGAEGHLSPVYKKF